MLSKLINSSCTSLTNKHLRAVRTPVTKARKGGLKDAYAEELLSAVLRAVVERSKIDPKLIDDVQVGNVLPAGSGAMVARMAMFHAGLTPSALHLISL